MSPSILLLRSSVVARSVAGGVYPGSAGTPTGDAPATARQARRVSEGTHAFRTRTGLCQLSNQSLFARGNSAGKRFGEARDRGGIFGDTGRVWAVETALTRVSGGKAAESQRLFPRRQETGFAQDCVVVSGGLELRAMHAVPSNRSLRTAFLLLGDLSDTRIDLPAASLRTPEPCSRPPA
jgi:hypothetical protein